MSLGPASRRGFAGLAGEKIFRGLEPCLVMVPGLLLRHSARQSRKSSHPGLKPCRSHFLDAATTRGMTESDFRKRAKERFPGHHKIKRFRRHIKAARPRQGGPGVKIKGGKPALVAYGFGGLVSMNHLV